MPTASAEAEKHAAMEESEAMHEDATGVTFQAVYFIFFQPLMFCLIWCDLLSLMLDPLPYLPPGIGE